MWQNPLNQALRFLLEIAALIAVGVWGWSAGSGAARYLLALGLPAVAATLWGVFRVPDEPPAMSPAPVAVPGLVRLLLELALFAVAVWGLFDAGATTAAWLLGGIALGHYLISADRLLWLVRH